jgi:hypothetical protein
MWDSSFYTSPIGQKVRAIETYFILRYISSKAAITKGVVETSKYWRQKIIFKNSISNCDFLKRPANNWIASFI